MLVADDVVIGVPEPVHVQHGAAHDHVDQVVRQVVHMVVIGSSQAMLTDERTPRARKYTEMIPKMTSQRPSGSAFQRGELSYHGHPHQDVGDVDGHVVAPTPPLGHSQPGDAVDRDGDHENSQAVGQPGGMSHDQAAPAGMATASRRLPRPRRSFVADVAASRPGREELGGARSSDQWRYPGKSRPKFCPTTQITTPVTTAKTTAERGKGSGRNTPRATTVQMTATTMATASPWLATDVAV